MDTSAQFGSVANPMLRQVCLDRKARRFNVEPAKCRRTAKRGKITAAVLDLGTSSTVPEHAWRCTFFAQNAPRVIVQSRPELISDPIRCRARGIDRSYKTALPEGCGRIARRL